MALWGGLSRQADGREVLQLFVSAGEVQRLLESSPDRYMEFAGEELDLEIHGRRITDAWLSVVPDGRDDDAPPRN